MSCVYSVVWCSVVHILWNFGGHTEILFDFVLGVLVGILKQSSGETPNESRYKSGGDRYRSRIPAVQEFYCLFLDHCIDLCYHHHQMMVMNTSGAFKV